LRDCFEKDILRLTIDHLIEQFGFHHFGDGDETSSESLFGHAGCCCQKIDGLYLSSQIAARPELNGLFKVHCFSRERSNFSPQSL